MSAFVCVPIPALGDPLRLSLPGGVTLEQQELMQVVQPALAPLVPIFDIVDTVIAAFECIKAIPASLGPPPDPTLLASSIEALAEKAMKLLRLVPQLSLPYTIVDVIDLIVSVLRDTQVKLHHLQAQVRKIMRAVDRTTELQDAGLSAIIECANQNVAQEAGNVGRGLASVGRLIALVNTFLDLIGAPRVPSLSSLSGQAMDVVVDALDVFVNGLVAVRRAIPLR